MVIKVLGTGCPTCKKLLAEVEKAVASSGIPAEIEKVDRLDDIMRYRVMMMPAIVINDQVKASGRVVSSNEILNWMNRAAAEEAR